MTSARIATEASLPSRWWYAVAAMVVFAGFAGMGGYLLPRLNSFGESLMRTVVPGEATLTLSEPGTYTIFHEERSVVDGQLYVSDTISGLRVSVQAMPSDEKIAVLPATMSESYSLGSHTGRSAFTFDIAKPGQYRLTAGYDDGRGEPKVVLAIGHNFLSNLIQTILGALAIAFGAIAAAIVIVVVVAQKRSAASAINTARESNNARTR